MSTATPAQFLQSLAQALSTMTLYTSRHPACIAVADASFARLKELVKTGEYRFSFLGEAVVANDKALHELHSWPIRAACPRYPPIRSGRVLASASRESATR